MPAIRGKSPRQALSASEELTRGRVGRIVLVLAIWALVSFITSAIALGLVNLLGSWAVPPLMNSLRPLILALSGLIVFGVLLSLPIGAFNSGGFAYLILVLYEAVAGAVPTSALPGARTAQSTRVRGLSGRAATLMIVAVAA